MALRPGYRLLLALLLAGCVRPPGAVPPAAPGPLVLAVVTWNLHAGSGDLPRFVSDLSSGRLTDAPAPDFVLLLQEASEQDLAGVTDAAIGPPPYTFFAPVRRDSPRPSGNAILATKPLSETREIDLPRERQPRAAAAANITIGGERLFVVSAHLENRLGWLRGLFGDRARRRQADALLAALPADGHGILGGDMNTMLGPSEDALEVLRERFDDTPDEPLAPTFRDRLILDHLFFDVPDGWMVARRVIENRYGSDHHPVLGVVAFSR